MADVNTILSRLDKVKRRGEGKWQACCPAHDDRSPSLAIKATNEGKILIHCFAGCSINEIVSSIGLEMSDLMPEKPTYKKGTKPPKFNKYELFDRLSEEAAILIVAIRQIFKEKSLSESDMERVNKAEEIIDDILREVRQ